MNSNGAIAYLKGGLLAAPILLFWAIASLLPVRAASRFGGWLFATIGPHTAKQRHVRGNLSVLAPQFDEHELTALSRRVWRNLGEVMAEYPHLSRLATDRTTLELSDEFRAILAEHRPFLVLSGHIANWEVLATCMSRLGVHFDLIYAKHKNPVVEWAIQRYRRFPTLRYVDKRIAIKAMFDAARDGRSIGLLPDQRVDTGLPLEFFHREANTTISPARMARKLGYPIIPAHVERLPGVRFRVTFHAPLETGVCGSEKDQAVDLTVRFNRMLEDWIAADPGVWLCTKRRWPKVRPLAPQTSGEPR